MMWNHRMFLMTGDAKYMDVFERPAYNGFLSGVSVSGDRFFYTNPVAYDGSEKNNSGHAGRVRYRARGAEEGCEGRRAAGFPTHARA